MSEMHVQNNVVNPPAPTPSDDDAAAQNEAERFIENADQQSADEADAANDETETASSTNASGVNDTRFNDFMKEVRKFGREAGAGEDSLPKLGISVTRAARDGVIDSETNKNVIKEVYQAYMDQRAEKRIHAQTKEGMAAQVSKLKRFEKLGRQSIFDGEELLDKIINHFKDLVKSGVKPKSVYAAYSDAALAANTIAEAEKREPTDDELRTAMLPKEKSQKSLTDVLGDLNKALESVITGERKDGLKCQDQEIIDAQSNLAKWLATMTLKAEMDAFQLQAQKLGVHVTLQ